ncbi:MAG TPA: hypothetical protein VLX28_18395 [Thermoanaerobaculia bacterium]|nr:hypothetical protein [Thermoanaerobaculia bacterium]
MKKNECADPGGMHSLLHGGNTVIERPLSEAVADLAFPLIVIMGTAE